MIIRYIKVCFAAIVKRTFSNIPNISGGHGSRIGTSWCACRLHLHWRFGLFSARAGDRGGYLRPNLDMQRFSCEKYVNVGVEDRLLIVDDYCVVYVVYVVFAFVRDLGKIRMYVYVYIYIPDLFVTSIAVTYPIFLRPTPPYHDDTHELQELVMKTVALKTLNLVIHLHYLHYLFRCLMDNKGNGEHGHRGAIGRSTWQTTTARASWMPW